MSEQISDTLRSAGMRLIFVRHGETEWNETLRYQGHAPIPLNTRGRDQSRRAGERLLQSEATVLYSSDIPRAWETAVILGHEMDIEPTPMEELREIDVGQWQGLTPEELEQRFPDHMREYEADPANTVRLGGESYAQLQARGIVALQRIQEAHTLDETVLAVSHGGTIRAIICHVIGLELKLFSRMWLDNGSLTELRYNGESWRLLRLNDAAHLE